MSVLVVSGSPRGDGHTALAVKKVYAGLGDGVTAIDLAPDRSTPSAMIVSKTVTILERSCGR